MKILSLGPFKNSSKTLGLSELVSTRVSIEVYRNHQNKPRQGRRYRDIKGEIKMSTQENPMIPKPSQANTNQ